MFRGFKDGALGLGIKSFLNERFGEYGEIQECEIDTEASQIRLRALLDGEKEIVTASIERYELQREGDETYIVLKKLSSSREWLTTLLRRLLKDKRYKIPAAVARML